MIQTQTAMKLAGTPADRPLETGRSRAAPPGIPESAVPLAFIHTVDSSWRVYAGTHSLSSSPRPPPAPSPPPPILPDLPTSASPPDGDSTVPPLPPPSFPVTAVASSN